MCYEFIPTKIFFEHLDKMNIIVLWLKPGRILKRWAPPCNEDGALHCSPAEMVIPYNNYDHHYHFNYLLQFSKNTTFRQNN